MWNLIGQRIVGADKSGPGSQAGRDDESGAPGSPRLESKAPRRPEEGPGPKRARSSSNEPQTRKRSRVLDAPGANLELKPKPGKQEIDDCINAMLGCCVKGKAADVELLWRHGCEKGYFDGIEAMQAIFEAACFGGHVEIVDWALQHGASVHKTPGMLDVASGSGRTELVKCLLYRHRPDEYKEFNHDGAGALLMCFLKRQESAAWLLLQSGVSTDTRGRSGRSALALACGAGFLELAQTLYRRDPSVHDPATRAECLADCLMQAACEGHLAVVEWLVGEEVQADPNFQDRSGRSILHRLCSNSAYASTDPIWVAQIGTAFEVLLSLKVKPADPFLPDRKGCTPLMMAAGIPGMPLFGMLFDPHVLNAQDSKGRTALTYAVSANRADAVEQLVDCGAVPYVPDNEGKNLLMTAVSYCRGDLKIVAFLLQKGLKPDDVDSDGDSTVHYACRYDHLGALKLLWDHGANLNRPNNEGDTPFLVAAANGASQVLAWLLEHRIARVDERDADHQTVLHLAAAGGYSKAIEAVLPYGPDPDALTEQGNTPALYAAEAETGNLAVLECLRQAGANLRIANSEGNNALDLALRMCKYHVAQWLLEWGISPNQPLDRYTDPNLLCRDLLIRHGRLAHVPLEQVELSVEQILALPVFSAQYIGDPKERERWRAWLAGKGCSGPTVMRLRLLPFAFAEAHGPLARTTFVHLPQESTRAEPLATHSDPAGRAPAAKQGQYLMSLLLSDLPGEVGDPMGLPQLDSVPDFRQDLSLRMEHELQTLSEGARQALARRRQALMDELPRTVRSSIKIDGELNQSDLAYRLREENCLFAAVADCLLERVRTVHQRLQSASADLLPMGSLAHSTEREASVYRANFMQTLKLELLDWNMRHAEPALLRTVFLGEKPNRQTNYLLHQWELVCTVFDVPLPRPLGSYCFAEDVLPALSFPGYQPKDESVNSDADIDAGPQGGGPGAKPQPIREAWSPLQDLEFMRGARHFAWHPLQAPQRFKPDAAWLAGLAQTLWTREPANGVPYALQRGMLPATKRLLERHVEDFVRLCDALSRKPAEQLEYALGQAVRTDPTLAQRQQVMSGLLRLLPALSEEENLIWESDLLQPDKMMLTQRLSEEVDGMRGSAAQSWIASISDFAQEFPQRVVKRITFEGDFEEQALRDELVRDFGLFQPVLDLLMHATRLALQRRGQGAADLPRMGSRGTVQRALGERYLEFKALLQEQLQQWFAPQAGQEGEPYQLPDSFLAGFRKGMEDLSGASGQAKDAYVDLVWGQWWSVRDALSASPLERKQAGTGAPPTASAWVFPSELNFDDLQLDF